MSEPLVSIGLPVYNGGKLLLPCLDSLVRQTYGNIEFIISDNASTDGTKAVCEAYAARDPRIRFVTTEKNRGAAWNHRQVLELARGEYFKWCGADDAIAPRFVEACVAALTARPDAVLAFPLTVVMDEDGQSVRKTTDRLPVSSPDPRVRFQALLSNWEVTHSPFYGVMRCSALARTRPFGDFLAGDRSFLAELALKGPFLQVEEFLMYRRNYSKHWKRTAEIEQELLNPAGVEDFCPRELTMLREHTISSIRMDASIASRLRVIGAVGHWAFLRRRDFLAEGRAYVARALRRVARRRPRAT
ncbi:MAG: glycosyltransferase family 2 protein [bacterium]